MCPTNPPPPDPDNLNDQRAAWARCAVQAFAAQTGQLKGPGGRPIPRPEAERLTDQLTRAGEVEDLEEAVGDLLCDLLHLADREGLDVELLIERAIGNHAQETAEHA